MQLSLHPSEGIIPASQSQIVEVDITLKITEKGQSVSESSSVIVTDIHSPAPPQAITVSVLAETRPKSPTKKMKKRKSYMVLSEELPELNVKGATPLDANRYEINLGQYSRNSGPVVWELQLENNSPLSCTTPLEYRISTIDPEKDKKWIVSSLLLI